MKTEVLWTEDDCTCGTEGHEGLGEAWLRLFGKPYDQNAEDSRIDHGDAIEHRFGDISVWDAPDGHQIERRVSD